jgi:UV DNA damage endonuclease
MIRLGLCCVFLREPIRFRQTTAMVLGRRSPAARREALGEIALHNAEALRAAVEYCARQGIGAFRINSQILPLKTHPRYGYDVSELPGGSEIVRAFRRCGALARAKSIRLSFHPDQFVVLNSPRPEVVEASIRELEYQAEVASWVGADVINLHAGGAYGDKPAALGRLRTELARLPRVVRSRLTLENDDHSYTPSDLLPLCREMKVPLVYDVHHHRCLPDGLTVEAATAAACQTWTREPLVHVSSPLGGWRSRTPRRHADTIQPRDFPSCWLGLALTVEVEAKAKELAVRRLARWLAGRAIHG